MNLAAWMEEIKRDLIADIARRRETARLRRCVAEAHGAHPPPPARGAGRRRPIPERHREP